MTDHETLRSADDTVDLHVHYFADPPTPAATVLLSHATGFHSHCYVPIARALGDRLRVAAIDHRGHGLTEAIPGWHVDWAAFGDDVGLVAEHLGGPVVGFGHSMGGAALLLAAAERPELFERLVVFEPIAPPEPPPGTDRDQIPIAAAARRRRDTFESVEAAISNYSRKPPLSLLDPEALRLYVEHGFRPAADGGITLRCRPELEAATFSSAIGNGLNERLASITTPTLVMAGAVEPDGPSAWAADIAARLPEGSYLELPELTHFGPVSHPGEVAGLIADAVVPKL